jgi:hypothetical protein
MTIGLKITLIGSFTLAAFLNLVQFEISYAQHVQALNVPKPIALPISKITPLKRTPAVLSPTITPTVVSQILPASDQVTTMQFMLAKAGLKPEFANDYLKVQEATGTPWQLLAAVHKVETGQSGDTTRRSFAGAIGPMQFMPATFAHYAQDGNNDGVASISSLSDALLTAGRYLAAGGAIRGDYSSALFHYNHSSAYVGNVLTISRRLGL